MRWIGLILLIILFGTCKPEYQYGRIAFQTQDSSLLPLYIYIGHNNLIDTITEVANDECHISEKYIDLIADNTFEFIIYGNQYDSKRNVYVKENECRMINITR